MGTLASLQIKGLKELDKFLKLLPAQPLRTVTKAAIKASGKPVVKQIRINLNKHSRSGGLKKSVIQKSITKRDPANVAIIIGFRLGLKGSKNTGPHAHLVEFGTGPRINKAGKSTGQMPATPFFRPALDSTREIQFQTLARELKKRIEKMARKIARKAGSIR